MGKNRQSENEWAEAKHRCQLNDDDVRMAKELGFTPRALIKNIPSPSQRWKAPVRDWIHGLYAEKHSAKEAEPSAFDEPPAEEPDDVEEFEDPEQAYRAFLRSEREPPTRPEIEEQDARMLRRQRDLRTAAEYVAREFAGLPEVARVGLFGSVAEPLRKEIPRFSKFRRNRVPVWHECADVDLAVWMTDLSNLKAMQKARGRALNRLQAERDIGVAHFNVDVHIMERGTDRYRGRLCTFGECPKPGKDDCYVAGCGVQPFLQQFANYEFNRVDFLLQEKEIFFERGPSADPRPTGDVKDEDLPF